MILGFILFIILICYGELLKRKVDERNLYNMNKLRLEIEAMTSELDPVKEELEKRTEFLRRMVGDGDL